MSDEPQSVLAPETTAEQDRKTAGFRSINRLWELTQMVIAVGVTLTTLLVCAVLIIQRRSSESAFLLLSNAFFLVVGTYFQRTNHTKSRDPSDTNR